MTTAPGRIRDVAYVRHIVLARPEKRNALNGEMFRRLSDAIHDAAAVPSVRVVVLRG